MKTDRSVILAALVTALCMVGDSMLYIVMPVHSGDFGLDSLWQVGVLLSVNRLVRLPLNPLAGWLYRRISARTGMLAVAALAVFTTAGYGIASGFGPFLTLRCLWGLAWTLLRMGAYFTVIEHGGNGRGAAMGRYNGLMRLGSLAGMLTGGALADFFGVTVASFFFAAVSAAAFPLIYIAAPRNAENMAPPAAEGEKEMSLLAQRRVLYVLVIGLVIAFVYQGMFISTVSYLVDIHETPDMSVGGFILGAATLAGILQAVRWGWEPWLAPWFGALSDGSFGRGGVLTISALVGAVLFALAALPIHGLAWILAILLLQVTATSLTTLSDAVAVDAALSSDQVKVMTLYSMLLDMGAALGPVAAYAANQYIADYASCWLAALLLLASAGLYRMTAGRAG